MDYNAETAEFEETNLLPNSLKICEGKLTELQKETNELLDKVLNEVENAENFFSIIEKIELKLENIKSMPKKTTELDANEAALLIKRIENDSLLAESYTNSIFILENEDKFAGEIEQIKKTIEKLMSRLNKMKDMDGIEEGLEVLAHISEFNKEAEICKRKIEKIKKLMSKKSKKGSLVVKKIKRKISSIKTLLEKSIEQKRKKDLRRHIDKIKEELTEEFKKTKKFNFTIDLKNFTFITKKERKELPLTIPLKYALSEMLQIESMIRKVGKNGTTIIGEYEDRNYEKVIKVGERKIIGNTIFFHEKVYKLE